MNCVRLRQTGTFFALRSEPSRIVAARARARHVLPVGRMDVQHLIVDLQACVADGEWERAGTYFGDLRPAVQEIVRSTETPRIAGAIAATLTGVERAFERNDAKIVSVALRHLVYLLDKGAPTSVG